MAHGLAGLLDDPLLLHPLGELFGSSGFELEPAAEDHQFVETAFTIGKDEIVARRSMSPVRVITVAWQVHWPMSPPRLPALPCRAPPIVPGIPTSGSRPAKPSRTATARSSARVRAAAGRDGRCGPISMNAGRGQPATTMPRDTFIAHQHVRSAAEQSGSECLPRRSGEPAPQVPRACAARRKTRPARPDGTTCAARAVQLRRTIGSKPVKKA